jgi:hypothetical protein
MREKVRAAHPVKPGRFDLKHSAGGMIDVEFAVQALVLGHGAHRAELLDDVGNIALLRRAEDAALSRPASASLRPTRTAICGARNTGRASTSSRRRSTRARSPRSAARSSRSGGRCSADGGRTWCALAVALALGALVGFALVPAQAIDWQPALAAREPWRAWSAAFVHYSALHLLDNLAGIALVGALGAFARVPWPSAAAWLPPGR